MSEMKNKAAQAQAQTAAEAKAQAASAAAAGAAAEAAAPEEKPTYVQNTFATGALKQTKRRGSHHGRVGRMVPGEKPKDMKGVLRRMFEFMGGFRLSILVAAVFAVCSTVFSVIGPKVLSMATTVLFEGAVAKANGTGAIDFEAIARILAATICIYLVSSAFHFAMSWIMAGVAQKSGFRLRCMISEKINRMPFGYFERNATGDTLSRITNDVDTFSQNLAQTIDRMIISVVTVVGVLAVMLSINWLMTLVTLLIVPLSGAIVAVVVKKSQPHFKAQQRVLGEIDGMIEEDFAGQQIVKAFAQEKAAVETFNEANERLCEAAWKSQFISGLMRPVMDLVGNLGYVAVAVLGTWFAVMGAITVGDIQAFIQYVKNFTQPLSQLSQVSNMLQQMAAAAERIFAFLDEPEEEPQDDLELSEPLQGAVEFDHVSFGYIPGTPVIQDFSAKVEPGQTVALVGPTGAGKTTLVKLLMRFYDVEEGSISIDGHNVRELSRAQVRNSFGMVLQDTWLYNTSIRENIRYGRLDATDEEVEAAAVAGCADHFIRTLPGGYDFVINEDASNISLGQRQLLTIARAILADRPMLILDEATSSVDTRTEERIQQAFDNLMEGRTCFVIAHRLSTIKNADLILVIRDGNIVEQGNHAQLLDQGGFYSELYNAQFEL